MVHCVQCTHHHHLLTSEQLLSWLSKLVNGNNTLSAYERYIHGSILFLSELHTAQCHYTAINVRPLIGGRALGGEMAPMVVNGQIYSLSQKSSPP